MAKDMTSQFLDALISRLAMDPALVNIVADRLADRLLGTSSGGGGYAPAKRAYVRTAPGRKSPTTQGTTDRVLAAIRGGAQRRSDIVNKSGVSFAGYKYALKVLSHKGLVKVSGTRGGAIVTPS